MAAMQLDSGSDTPEPPVATCIATLEGHEERAWHCEFSRDGSLLASCGSDRTVRVWQRFGDSWREAARLDDAHDRTVRRCAWSPCGRLLAAVSFDATCCVWRRADDGPNMAWEILATLEGHENEVKCAAWNASATLLATCGRDKSVWLWEFVDDEAFELLTVLHGHGGDVKAACFDLASSLRDDDLLASCSYDDKIRVWGDDGDDWSSRCVLEGHASTVWDVAFCASPDGARRLVSCGADGAVRVWAEATPGEARAWTCLCALEEVHARPAREAGAEILVPALLGSLQEEPAFRRCQNKSERMPTPQESAETALEIARRLRRPALGISARHPAAGPRPRPRRRHSATRPAVDDGTLPPDPPSTTAPPPRDRPRPGNIHAAPRGGAATRCRRRHIATRPALDDGAAARPRSPSTREYPRGTPRRGRDPPSTTAPRSGRRPQVLVRRRRAARGDGRRGRRARAPVLRRRHGRAVAVGGGRGRARGRRERGAVEPRGRVDARDLWGRRGCSRVAGVAVCFCFRSGV